jgi:hypothetical protein
VPASGNWTFSQRTDPLTSEVSSWFTLRSSPEWQAGLLSVRCSSGRVQEANIQSQGPVWARPLAHDQGGLIGQMRSKDGIHGKNTFRVRLDDQKPFDTKWFVEEDYRTFRLDKKDWEKVLRAAKVVVQYTGPNRSLVSVVFNTQGLDGAGFSKACGEGYGTAPDGHQEK